MLCIRPIYLLTGNINGLLPIKKIDLNDYRGFNYETHKQFNIYVKFIEVRLLLLPEDIFLMSKNTNYLTKNGNFEINV